MELFVARQTGFYAKRLGIFEYSNQFFGIFGISASSVQ